MTRYEWKFLDGPGAGRPVFSDHAPEMLWLCNRRGNRWLTFTRPEAIWIEFTYKLRGHCPRLDGTALLLYEVVDD